MPLGERARRAPVPRVVGAHVVERRRRLARRVERQHAVAGRQPRPEAGVLRDDRAARRQVAQAAIAEPAAGGGHVARLREAELTPRALHERAVVPWGRGDDGGVEQPPAVAPQRDAVRVVAGMDRQRGRDRRVSARGQVEQRAHRVGLLPVVHAAVVDRSVAAPVADRRRRVVHDRVRHRPVLEHERLHRRYPAPPQVGTAQPARPISVPIVMKRSWRSRPRSMPSAAQSCVKPGSRSTNARSRTAASSSSSASRPEMFSSRSAPRTRASRAWRLRPTVSPVRAVDERGACSPYAFVTRRK